MEPNPARKMALVAFVTACFMGMLAYTIYHFTVAEQNIPHRPVERTP